jgi:uroporphyrinogen decarboxylase
MTSRERVIATINHHEPDKCPIDFGGSRVTGIHADLYVELGKYLGIDTELPRVYDIFQFLARVEENVRRRFCGDVIHLENYIEYFELKNENWKVWHTKLDHDVLVPGDFNPIEDERGYLHLKGLTPETKNKTLGLMPKDGIYFERYNEPSEIHSYDDPMSPEEWGRIYDERYDYTDEELRKLENTAKYLHDYTDYAIMGGFNRLKMTSPVTYAGHSIQDWLMRLLDDEDYVEEILGVTADHCSAIVSKYLQAVGNYIDVIDVSTTDYGTQDRELFSPDVFEDLYVKPIKKVNDTIHSLTKAKVFYHTCGCVIHFIPHFIEAGIDILNPIQTSAAGMNPKDLKEKYGKDIVFWGGGMDIQHTLPNATPDEIDKIVKERMEIFKPGGGYVYAAEHNLQYGVDVKNIVKMYDSAIKYRDY